MALTPGTPFEVVMQGELLAQACYNTYFLQADTNSFYPRMPDGDTEIQECLQQWVDIYWDGIAAEAAASLSADYNLNTWKARNLFDAVSLYAGTFTTGTTPGTGTGNMPPNSTISLYSPTKRAHQNGGHKSIGGLIEGSVTDGILVAGTVTNWQNFCDAVLNVPQAAGVTLSYGLFWNVVNVKTIMVPGDAFHDRYYRLPTDATEYAAYVADNWIVQPNASTRNSRKYGRGI